MQISGNKTKTTITIALALLMISMAIIAVPVKAQNNLATGTTNPTNLQEGGSIPLPNGVTADLTEQTTAYLSFRPSPVGVGQAVLVNMWITPPLHVSRYIVGYTVTIQKPDGTTETHTLNSYRADTTAWFTFTPDQAGTYKFKFDNPGAYYPAGNYTIHAGAFFGTTLVDVYTNFTQSCYYTPSSTGWQTLTVQQDMVASWPPSPLPTDYWTRPVQPDNREWAPIIGDFPWYGPAANANYPADTNIYTASQYKFTPYVQAPNSAHIVWMAQNAIGGIMGGDSGDYALQAGGGNPTIIYQGRGYQTITEASTTGPGTQTFWECYDIRTGQLYWSRPLFAGESAASVIEYDPGHGEVPGAEAGDLGASQNLIAFASGRLLKFSPTSGGMTANFSIAPLTTATYIMNGYALGVQSIVNTSGTFYRLINFTTYSAYHSASDLTLNPLSIQNNITWPWSSTGMLDLSSGYAAQANDLSPVGSGAFYGTNIKAASLVTGQEVWNINDTATQYSSSCAVADHGKVAFLTMGGYYKAYNLANGQLAWQGQMMDYPWSSPGFGAYSVQSAYGLIYREAYDGVYAFDWNNGKIVWRFEATANSFETPYTDANGSSVYSFNAGGILADGKIFVYNTEHTPSQPITRGWRLFCINATTGAGLWNITGIMTPGAIADGYLTASNSYDGYMYVFGKGQSATTVSAPQTAITAGTPAIISGTVLDQSPAQKGKACVSEASMTTYMEYIHMQQPIDGLWHNITVTGVPVSIDAVDPNGNSMHIGTATSDVSGIFAYTWTPAIAGNYKIMATFIGSNSYGSSYGETAATVVNAPAITSTATPNQATAATTSDVMTFSLIGAIIVIIALAIVAVLLLKRKA